MTKQTDRLTRVETKVDGLIDMVNKFVERFDAYTTKAYEGRGECLGDIGGLKTQTNIQWGVIGGLVAGIIGVWFKK